MARRRSTLKIITVKIDETELSMIEELAFKSGKTRSDLIRAAVWEYIRRHASRPVPRVKIIYE
jgi:metal-responsive CopG/Arc/MetJ family transcriptional regulator